ncbi:hypothetical protein NC651_029917 [Populus alba x Populus x berolinensis]|nr:hypothetical protein NC651_029917 [Populus alba x Populus x berolinensis]
MAGICSLNPTTLMTFKRIHGIRFISGATDNERVFSFSGKERYLPYYSPSSIAFSACFLGRCPETNKMKQIRVLFLVMRYNFRGFLGIML